MEKVLHIMSSPRVTDSVSRRLGSAVVGKIREKYPDCIVNEYDLARPKVPHLDEAHINSFFTPAGDRLPGQQLAIKPSDEAIAALEEADIIVIEAPMYNFTITSTLKAYLDQIARAGITFKYVGNGHLPVGLLKNKQAYLAITSGGIYAEGELKPYDFIEPYLRFLLTLIGITIVGVFRAEGQAIVGPEKALEKGIESIVIA
jgi:FMN-dependent NADH-azoreductase